ncbi:hypothetical protein Tco_1242830, partial [Tanacetum coccineum]
LQRSATVSEIPKYGDRNWRDAPVKKRCFILKAVYSQNVRFAKLSSDTGRKQEAHSKGHVLDNVILSDPEVQLI